MKRSNNVWKGVGIGAGLTALGAAAGGLVLAYRHAKKNDKTINDLISGKKNKLKNAKCLCCGNNPCTCNESADDTQILDGGEITPENFEDFLDGLTEEELEELLYTDKNPDEDIEAVKLERDHYKEEYERLLAQMTAEKGDDSKKTK